MYTHHMYTYPMYTHHMYTHHMCTHHMHSHHKYTYPMYTHHMYTHVYTSHVHTCTHMYTHHIYTHHMYTHHMYTHYMYTNHMYTYPMYTHVYTSHVHTSHVDTSHVLKPHVHTSHVHISHVHTSHVHTERYITNLSSKPLSSPQLDVLALGLTFIPSWTPPKVHLPESLNSFDRNNRLKYFFRNQPSTEPHPFKKKSTWEPPSASLTIEKYLKRIRTQIDKLHPLKVTPNLSPIQTKALKQLSSDKSLVIKSADKGSGIVVEDTHQYVKDGLDHLSDETIYENVSTDPTIHLTKAINTYIDSMYQEGIIDPLTREYLTLSTEPPPRTQQLYFLKKIHKNPIAVRPIVSGCGGPTENISQLVDLHLKPHVPKIKSYLRDS